MKHEHHTPSGAPGRRGTGGPRRGGPFGRPGGRQHGGWQQGDLPDATDAAAWFAGRIPDEWFTGDLLVTVDRDENTVMSCLHPRVTSRPRPRGGSPVGVRTPASSG